MEAPGEPGLANAASAALVGKLLVTLAHDLKNPLATLQMGIDYLVRQPPGRDAGSREVLGDMESSLGRLRKLVDDLANLSAGSPASPRLREDDVNLAVEHVLGWIGPHFVRRRVEVERCLAEDLPPVALDRPLFSQALLQVLLNSVQAMPAGGKLVVRTHFSNGGTGFAPASPAGAENTRVCVSIQDTGVGLAEEILPCVFNAFFTTRAREGGAGLGLALVRMILEAHGGAVTLENRAEGGARALFLLPPSDGRRRDEGKQENEDPHRR